MESEYTQALADLGITLTSMAVKGTATAINTKVKALKSVKDAESVRNAYDEIVNELISEREEAIRIAQVYKAELDRIVISDDDIEHLHATVSRLLDLLKVMAPNTNTESLNTMKDLISVDTLKTMQLLGFNYKAAIGEPLTEICANAISSWGDRSHNNHGSTSNKNSKKK